MPPEKYESTFSKCFISFYYFFCIYWYRGIFFFSSIFTFFCFPGAESPKANSPCVRTNKPRPVLCGVNVTASATSLPTLLIMRLISSAVYNSCRPKRGTFVPPKLYSYITPSSCGSPPFLSDVALVKKCYYYLLLVYIFFLHSAVSSASDLIWNILNSVSELTLELNNTIF